MNIKTFFIILSYLLIIISLLFVVAISDLSKVSQKFKDIEYNRYLMFEKANELKQSSDNLTKYARAYISTKDKKYKNIYFHILDIRNGIARRPLDYDSTYWAISQSIKSQHHPLGKPSSLISEMRKLPYLPFEFKKSDEAELNSNELVQVEVEAFNVIEGLFKDDDGSYSIQKAPDPLLAVNLLNSKQYNHAKEKIMNPIDDLLHSLSSRTSIATTNQNNLILRAFDRLYFLLFITFLILILVAIIIKKKILDPIQYFTEVITSLKAGDQTVYKGKIYNDELGLMINNFYDMKEVIDDDLKRLTFALNAANQGWFDLNLQSGTVTVSDEYAVMLGYEPDEFHSTLQEWQDNVHPDDKNAALDSVQECLTTKKATTHEYRRKNKQGDWIWLHSIGEVVEFDINDKPVRIIGVKTNITERKQHEIRENIRISVLELLVTNAPLQKILNAILSIVESDEPNIICSILLLDKEKKHLFTGAAPSLPDFYNQTLNGVEIGYGVGSCAAAAFTKKRVIVEDISTHPYWKRFTKIASKADLGACCSQPIIDSQGGVLGTFAIYHRRPNTPSKDDLKLIDFVVTLSTIAIERSRINEQMLLAKKVFNSTHEGITVTDPMGIILDVNPAFSNITGYSKEEAMGKNPSILNSGKHKPEFYKNMWQCLKKHNYWQGDVWNRKKNGELYAQSLTISALKNNDGLVNYVALFSDVTHAKEQQEQLKLMAHYDVLTKLPNRALFIDRFNRKRSFWG